MGGSINSVGERFERGARRFHAARFDPDDSGPEEIKARLPIF
jgi:hypothetical protein